jgi:hypothetical protein
MSAIVKPAATSQNPVIINLGFTLLVFWENYVSIVSEEKALNMSIAFFEKFVNDKLQSLNQDKK